MDPFLMDYLRSGKAWVLVGTGPSIQMGYPSWEELASVVVETATIEAIGSNLSNLNAAMKCRDFPTVFEEAKAILGAPRLLQSLQAKLKPTRPGTIYELIAQWPVPVFLTTNYDDEIQTHLANLGEAYLTYSNTEDHLAHLLPELSGAIFKLHGDLRSELGLILTTSDYREIDQSDSWRYWRTKITSVFQMNRLVVIGHSLSDRNIKHVLEAAKQDAGVHQPICWIAPNVSFEVSRQFLEKYRIRVISYDNQDGHHRNLLQLIQTITDFTPPRTAIHIQEQIAEASESPLGTNAAAPGFFVFNKLTSKTDFDQKRLDIMLAAIQSILPELISLGEFTLQTALEFAGWPKDLPMPLDFATKVGQQAIKQELLEPVANKFKVHNRAQVLALENKNRFEHMRERFKNSLTLRLERSFPSLSEEDISLISSDIDASLAGYFREGGLSLTTILFSQGQRLKQITLPFSIIKFITAASARYDDLLKRQAFFTASVDAFVRSGSAEREYLGRISQGFFAFHSFGTFGDAAIERLKNAKETVWLVDSDAQIPALALAAPTHAVFRDTFSRLYDMGIPLLTTEKLFAETRDHLWFADKVIRDNGPGSPLVLSAATGQPPYRKSNLFLEGFIRWQAAGNPCNWESYNFQIFGHRNPTDKDIGTALNKIGIRVIPFENWPGFIETDYVDRDQYTQKIKQIWLDRQQTPSTDEYELELLTDAYKKAQPEAEAFIIVKREREGSYYLLSGPGKESDAWFLSHTSILNIVEPGIKITWQPESFLRFVSTLSPTSDTKLANQAFETILWGVAQSGLSLLDEKLISNVFGGIIDEASLSISELKESYKDTLAQKYGESLDSVMARISLINRPLAVIQLSNEIAQREAQRRQHAEVVGAHAIKRAEVAEKKLKEVDRFRRKMEGKQRRAHRRAKKQPSSPKKKKKKTKK